ncbi:MAG: hypothetical protein KDA90_01330 [Planctomycetaceae bacterium]|nr:hypothetical protein [Planctomycetaceae bacterium]
MTSPNTSPDAAIFLKRIEEAENTTNEYAAFIKKLKGRLSKAKKALATKPAVASPVSTLISELAALEPVPTAPPTGVLASTLEDELKKLRRRAHESFPDELRRMCESANLHFAATSDGFGVGPFIVTINAAKETASFHFAKMDIKVAVPMNAAAIVGKAGILKASIIDDPVDLSSFHDELNEAMRVALARAGTSSKAEWRVELPAVYREMVIIRQNQPKRRKSSNADYSHPRFIVELKQFIQSEQNMRSEKQYRLETAVLENTKNPKKSLFIPRDLSRASGEGTYYQAILFQQV